MANKMAIDSLVNHFSNDNQPSEAPLPMESAALVVPNHPDGREDVDMTERQEPGAPETSTSTSKPAGRKGKFSSKLARTPEVAGEDTEQQLDDVILDDGEHVVPLGLPYRVHRHYVDILSEYESAQMELMVSLKPRSSTIAAIERMISELDSVLAHPDILDRTAFENAEEDLDDGEFNYSRAVSWKFGFLDILLLGIFNGTGAGLPQSLQERTKDSNSITVAVVVREGKLLDILTRFLIQSNLPFTTLNDGVVHNQQTKSPLRILVVPSNLAPNDGMSSVDLIYAMDSSFVRHSDLAKALRGKGTQKAHVIYPWVWGSPEHVRACMPPVRGYVDQLRVFTQILIQIRGELGKKEITYHTKAISVTNWVLEGFRQTFPEELGEGIKLTGLKLMFNPSKKRSLDTSEEDDPASPSKRKRMEDELMEDVPTDTLAPMDEISALRKQLAVAREIKKSDNEKIADLYRTARNLGHENGVIREELQEVRLEKENLWNEFKASERTAYGLMNACDDALNKKEDGLKRINILKLEREKLMATLEIANSRITELETEQRAASVAEDATNNVPAPTSDSATFLQLQSEKQALETENASLKKRLQLADGDRAYAMQLYQEASSKAVESSKEVSELQAEVDRLVPLAEGQSERALQDIDHSEVEATRIALDKALAEKEELEEQLRRGNGRIGVSTRGQSSAPASSRSPRVVPSPPRSRASSRQPASRANSPTRAAPGLRRGQGGRLGEH